ncbi:hypothetical protein BDR06DRAFT_858075, partial [Suillus hirtellus]
VWWITGHCKVPGNEMADIEAKQAAESWHNNGTVSKLPQFLSIRHLPNSISAIKQALKKDTRCRWEWLWTKSPHYMHMHSLDPDILSCSF